MSVSIRQIHPVFVGEVSGVDLEGGGRQDVPGVRHHDLDRSQLSLGPISEGVDAGQRWQSLAASWERTADDGFYAFNDLHAIMAFLGAGRSQDIARTLVAMRRAASTRRSKRSALPSAPKSRSAERTE